MSRTISRSAVVEKVLAALSKNLHEVVGQITASHVDTRNGVWEGETFVNRDNVGDTITGVEYDTGGTTRGVQREDGLDRDVECRRVERLKDNLGHLLTVGFRVDRRFGEQYRVLLGCDTEFVVEGVVPNFLHVIPVGDDTVLDWVSEGQDTTLALCLITNVGIFLAHTNHDTMLLSVLVHLDTVRGVVPMVARSADDRRCLGVS